MEGNRFPSSNFEKSSVDLDSSTETKKSKKKKSPEAVTPKSEDTKQETEKRTTFADRLKAAVGEKMIDDKAEDPNKSPRAEQKSPQAEAEEKPETAAETNESSNETEAEPGPEADAAVAEIKPEEVAEIDDRLIAGNIEELQAEIAATDDEATIVAAEAAIDRLENLPHSELDVEDSDDEPDEPDTIPEAMPAIAEDELRPFEDEEAIPLTPSGASTSSRGSGSGSGTPPTAPTAMSVPEPGSVPVGPFRSSVERPAPAEGLYSSADVALYERRAAGKGLLVGAVVGYLIGRRRGRIKTERRMNVVVQKLEKQVEAKQRIIQQQIETVKQQTRQEYWAKKGQKSPEVPSQAAAPAAERIVERPRAVARPERQPLSRPERAEARETQAERLPPSVELRNEDIRRISATIKVGETNLRKIYEAKLVSPNGLRRIVMEHLQGKDIRRGLAREFMAKELSFERDPRFRDILPQEFAGRQRSGGTGGIAVTNSVDLTTPLQQPIDEDSRHMDAPVTKISVKKPRHATASTGVLAILTVVALALAAYAVVLGLTR